MELAAIEAHALYPDWAAAWKFTDMQERLRGEVRACVNGALAAAMDCGQFPRPEALPEYVVETPADFVHGDFAVNLALAGARAFRLPPRQIAEAIVQNIPDHGMFEKVEIAGPGFINFHLGSAPYASCLMAACVCGGEYGRTVYGRGEKVNVEFVSANPTGPMHLGNARGAALGDCLAACLEWSGHEVCREFYVNDAGNQIAKFGKSLAARYLQQVRGEENIPFPEDGYQGDDIRKLAADFYALHGVACADMPGEKLEQALVDYALPRNIEALERDLAKYRVVYDLWFRESSLHEGGAVARVVEKLKSLGAAYEREGAIWYKATEEGAEKDEVLVRANGIPTYFAADIAYHANKFDRGFTRAIDIWGADHHGHVARMKGALNALGYDAARLDVVLMQFVQLVQGGKPVRMSKRTGKAITLTDLLDEVPIDSARFLFNMREPGSTIDFDLDQAVAQDTENPVYYVQYAHARICSILSGLGEELADWDWAQVFGRFALLERPEERQLIQKVSQFPGEVWSAAKNRDPARVTRFCTELAALFHRFYANCRVKGEPKELMQARAALCLGVKITLANALTMLNITVPEQM